MESVKEEFLKILSDYQGILHKVCLIYFRSETEREDTFQEIVYQLWKSYPRLQNKKSIGSWIYAVSINTSISKLKKNSRIDYRETPPEFPDPTTTFDLYSKNESFQLLLKAIYDLNKIDKSIMLLFLEEKSYDEIAEIIGISTSNVGVRINRAKAKIKKKFKNYYHETSIAKIVDTQENS